MAPDTVSISRKTANAALSALRHSLPAARSWAALPDEDGAKSVVAAIEEACADLSRGLLTTNPAPIIEE